MTPEWTRHGDCNGCGACCRILATPVMLRLWVDSLPSDYLHARGLEKRADGYARVQGDLVAPCPQLAASNQCRIQATKPEYCREYPTMPEQIVSMPCSYWFTRNGEAWGGQASPYPVKTAV